MQFEPGDGEKHISETEVAPAEEQLLSGEEVSERQAFVEEMEKATTLEELSSVLYRFADSDTAELTLGVGENAKQVPLVEILTMINNRDWMGLRENYKDDPLEQVLFKLRLSEEAALEEKQRSDFENNRAAFISAVQGAGSLEGIADALTQFANPDTKMVTLGVFDNAREVPLDELLEMVREGQWSQIGRKYDGIDDMLENAVFKLATAE